MVNMKLNPNQKITITIREREQIKKKAIKDALQIITYFPLLALRDEFGFGAKRLQRFTDRMHSDIEAYNKGYIDIIDIAETIKKETGIEIIEL